MTGHGFQDIRDALALRDWARRIRSEPTRQYGITPFTQHYRSGNLVQSAPTIPGMATYIGVPVEAMAPATITGGDTGDPTIVTTSGEVRLYAAETGGNDQDDKPNDHVAVRDQSISEPDPETVTAHNLCDVEVKALSPPPADPPIYPVVFMVQDLIRGQYYIIQYCELQESATSLCVQFTSSPPATYNATINGVVAGACPECVNFNASWPVTAPGVINQCIVSSIEPCGWSNNDMVLDGLVYACPPFGSPGGPYRLYLCIYDDGLGDTIVRMELYGQAGGSTADFITWETLIVGNPIDPSTVEGLVLPFKNQTGWTDCDFTNSTVTLSGQGIGAAMGPGDGSGQGIWGGGNPPTP